jgi:hypothetical protein
MAASWQLILTGDGTGKYTPTVKKDGTITGGTAQALATGESGAFETLIGAMERGARHVARQFKLGNVGAGGNIVLNIAVGSGYTPSVKTNFTSISGTASALVTHEVGEARPWVEALERTKRHVLRKVADGE